MSFWISKWHQEGIDSMVLTLRNQSGINDSMVGSLAESTWPEFGGSDVWGIENEFLGGRIISRSCLKLGDITSMGEFSLDVSTGDSKAINFWDPVLGLLG